MDVRDLLMETYDRIPEHVAEAVTGLSPAELVISPAPGANTIGWLVWHLTRVQDDHVAELRGADQVWVSGDWASRFGLAPDPSNTGYGHSRSDLESVRPESAEVLVEYYAAVAARTREFLHRLSEEELDRVVDDQWDPPVTMGVRLVSVADDDIQHAGQACYLRGLLARRT